MDGLPRFCDEDDGFALMDFGFMGFSKRDKGFVAERLMGWIVGKNWWILLDLKRAMMMGHLHGQVHGSGGWVHLHGHGFFKEAHQFKR